MRDAYSIDRNLSDKTRNMANVVLTVLSVTVGLFFILSGILKLNPVFSEEIYKEMVRNVCLNEIIYFIRVITIYCFSLILHKNRFYAFC